MASAPCSAVRTTIRTQRSTSRCNRPSGARSVASSCTCRALFVGRASIGTDGACWRHWRPSASPVPDVRDEWRCDVAGARADRAWLESLIAHAMQHFDVKRLTEWFLSGQLSRKACGHQRKSRQWRPIEPQRPARYTEPFGANIPGWKCFFLEAIRMSTALQKDSAMTAVAKLTLDNREVELPVVVGTEDERAVDIAKLRSETNYITLDDGYVNTGSTLERDHVSRRRAGNPPLPRLSGRAAGGELRFHRGLVPAGVWRVADRGAAGGLSPKAPPAHDVA